MEQVVSVQYPDDGDDDPIAPSAGRKHLRWSRDLWELPMGLGDADSRWLDAVRPLLGRRGILRAEVWPWAHRTDTGS